MSEISDSPKFYTEWWTSVKKETVFEGDFENGGSLFGAEIGKIGAEGVKIKFEARRKSKDFVWK